MAQWLESGWMGSPRGRGLPGRKPKRSTMDVSERMQQFSDVYQAFTGQWLSEED